MNKIRRKNLQAIIDRIEDIKSDLECLKEDGYEQNRHNRWQKRKTTGTICPKTCKIQKDMSKQTMLCTCWTKHLKGWTARLTISAK